MHFFQIKEVHVKDGDSIAEDEIILEYFPDEEDANNSTGKV